MDIWILTNSNFEETAEFDQIRPQLTGIGRALIKSESGGALLRIIEGRFHGGVAEGYARIFEKSGDCRLGFWKKDGVMSVPYGRWAWYLKSGQPYLKPGLYGAQKDGKNGFRYQIVRILPKN